MINNHEDPSKDLNSSDFDGIDISFRAKITDLEEASFLIVSVSTHIDEYNQPDLKALLSACQIIGKVLKKGDYVIFESTVYPYCTEDNCVPMLEKKMV